MEYTLLEGEMLTGCLFLSPVFQVFEGVYNNSRMLHFLTAVVVSGHLTSRLLERGHASVRFSYFSHFPRAPLVM